MIQSNSIFCTFLQESALEMKTQVDNAKNKKHINKINDLLSESSKVNAQTWKTSVPWPDQSVLENDSDWDNDEEGEEYEEQDEEEEEEEEEDL